MSSVRFSGPNNSTFFTTCCDTAICDDQQRCPSCKADVYPFDERMTQSERDEASGGYYNSKCREARWFAAKRGSY